LEQEHVKLTPQKRGFEMMDNEIKLEIEGHTVTLIGVAIH
jgi:hypothetical protein